MTTKKTDKDPARKPATGAGEIAADAADTEGHSMLHAEFHRQVATSRSREAVEWSRSEQARKQSKGKDKGHSSDR